MGKTLEVTEIKNHDEIYGILEQRDSDQAIILINLDPHPDLYNGHTHMTLANWASFAGNAGLFGKSLPTEVAELLGVIKTPYVVLARSGFDNQADLEIAMHLRPNYVHKKSELLDNLIGGVGVTVCAASVFEQDIDLRDQLRDDISKLAEMGYGVWLSIDADTYSRGEALEGVDQDYEISPRDHKLTQMLLKLADKVVFCHSPGYADVENGTTAKHLEDIRGMIEDI